MRIQHKIALPFTVLVIVATTITTLTARQLISASLEAALQEQVERASEVLAQSDFAVNRPILEQLKLLINAEIITYTRDGTVLATTLDPGGGGLLEAIRSTQRAAELLDGRSDLLLADVEWDGAPLKVAYRPLPSSDATVIAFAMETAHIQAATSSIIGTMALVAIVAIGTMALLSQLIAKSLTAPILELAAFTRSVAVGDRERKAGVRTRDEVGRLADAFDEMVGQLHDYEEKLLESEKLAVTGLLAAQVAHDIRNPLSSIKMEAQLLRTRLLPGAANEKLLAAILREIDRVDWVVKGLLELARPGELQREPTDLNQAIREVLDQVALQLRHRKIRVVRDFDPALPRLDLDGDRFKQGLLNVILNAADAMPSGGGLTARTAPDRDGGVRVEIVDDGGGIDPEIRDRLFDPFVSTKREGIGLGLVNAKNVVERHGGAIRLEARTDRPGTRVVIMLPLRGEDGAENTRRKETARG